VIYGYLFGIQSRPNAPVTEGDILFVLLIALLSGALTTFLLALRSRRSWSTFGEGAAFGLLAGVATGAFLLVWQLLFAVVVNLLLQRSGLFLMAAGHPYPVDPVVRFLGAAFVLLFTFLYSLAEGVTAAAGGALAGVIASFLFKAGVIRGKPHA
jgi:hypothetical protein